MNRQNKKSTGRPSNKTVGAKKTGTAKSSSPFKKKETTTTKDSFRPRSGSPSLEKKYSKPKLKEKLPDLMREDMRLNKYLSNAGIASRRQADVLIEAGSISVNGVVVTEMGYKVLPTDVVKYDGGTVRAEKKQYVLLNKPKGFITTMDDPEGRKTVISLVSKACKERIYPVGRLDKETTGVLLFTNDGDLAKRLTHPKHQVKKIYHVEVERPFSYDDLDKLRSGVTLSDGFIKCDVAEYVKNGMSHEIGVEIHSGKNRIVRRIFEKLGYTVVKLDRVQFASLTKKDLPRGMYRHLTEKEVSFLKMIS
ncbi:MAG TPA: pseudouridine synthase [Crocinitomicaceae bacterium]|nr:pseudouridine synthase [Crocinitomicaceae bacterium]